MSTDITDLDSTQSTDDTDPSLEEVEADIGTDGKRRPMPKYGLVEVGDELPEPISTSREMLYFNLLTPIAEDPDKHGRWYQVAEFNSNDGARVAAKELGEGKRPTPTGEWEFDHRRFPVNPDEPTGLQFSVLYARFLGA